MKFSRDIIIETLSLYGINIDSNNNYDNNNCVSTNAMKSKSIKEIKEEYKSIENDFECSNDTKQAYGAFVFDYVDDDRSGIQKLVEQALKRISAIINEEKRVHLLYSQQLELSSGKIAIGCDEVGRGPLAGPLTIGAVVLDYSKPEIQGINDSKQLSHKKRTELVDVIKKSCLAYSIQHISADFIDENGMSESLKKAFLRAIDDIDKQLTEKGLEKAEVVLLDGNPMRIDPREINVIKGDSKCAAIACASIIAKVERDNLMDELSKQYPEYGWDNNAGYGSQKHIQAIKEFGFTSHHRKSFCKNIISPE